MLVCLLPNVVACQESITPTPATAESDSLKNKPTAYWKDRLSEESFRICREFGTERPFTGQYNKHYDQGTYTCSSCGQELFSSETKYDSKTGWPSFWDPIAMNKIELHNDDTLFHRRIEIRCSRCGAHLGHVFPDGPEPTNQRYCINSVCLNFVPAQ